MARLKENYASAPCFSFFSNIKTEVKTALYWSRRSSMISYKSPPTLTSSHVSVHTGSSRRGSLPCQVELLLAYTSATSALPIPVHPCPSNETPPSSASSGSRTGWHPQRGDDPVSKVSFFIPQAREEGSLLLLYLHLPTSLSFPMSKVEDINDINDHWDAKYQGPSPPP